MQFYLPVLYRIYACFKCNFKIYTILH